MKRLKIAIVTMIMCAIISTSASIPTRAMGLFYAGAGRQGVYVQVTAHTTKGQKTPCRDFGLKKGKYVKKVTIRLREGDYNKSKSTSNGTITIKKANNPFATAYGTWKWTYK